MAQEGRDEKGKFSYGNQFYLTVKQNGGMSPTYEDPIEMAKKIGEYLDYAVSLAEKMVDYNPSISLKEDELCFGTEMSIILEMAKKIKERILDN